MEVRQCQDLALEEILRLYRSVEWKGYIDRADVLKAAYANSLCVLGAFVGDELVGIVRAVGDGQTIVCIQDLIVLPQYQRQGIGTKLLKAVIDKYSDVYQMQLLTDDTEKTRAFYRSVGFDAATDLGCVSLIRM